MCLMSCMPYMVNFVTKQPVLNQQQINEIVYGTFTISGTHVSSSTLEVSSEVSCVMCIHQQWILCSHYSLVNTNFSSNVHTNCIQFTVQDNLAFLLPHKILYALLRLRDTAFHRIWTLEACAWKAAFHFM